MTLDDIFEQQYRTVVDNFMVELKTAFPEADFLQVPQLFLPQWGKNYDLALQPMGYFGMDTRKWNGPLKNVVECYDTAGYDFKKERETFQSFEFLHWGTESIRKFWGFFVWYISSLYGVKLNELKNGNLNHIIDGFAWGNCYSIKKTGYSGCMRKHLDYRFARELSQKSFNKFDLANSVLHMEFLIVVCSDCWKFLGPMEQLDLFDGRIGVYRKAETIIFQLYHPQGMANNQDAEKNVQALIGAMKKYGFFCELTSIQQNGLQPRSREILERECIRIGDAVKATGMIALELRRQNSIMPVNVFESVLHCSDGFSLILSAAKSFKNDGRDDVADAIQNFFVS